MKIGLIDVDGHNFPNLPLMKLSAWYKAQDDIVSFYDPMFGGKYDVVFMSKVFTFTPDYQYQINADMVIKGGTGYYYPDGGRPLSGEVEHIYPDYSLYNEDKAYGFLTRGCPRNCEFCIVSKKEGRKSCKVAEVSEFWKGQKEIKLLDPNITACRDCNELFKDLIKTKALIDFTQGLDIRLMDEEKALLLNKMKIKMIHFAWDNYEFLTYEKLKDMMKVIKIRKKNISVFVLTNFNTTFEQDLERIYKLKELGLYPYVMIYEKWGAEQRYSDLQRWTNNKILFSVCDRFENVDRKKEKGRK